MLLLQQLLVRTEAAARFLALPRAGHLLRGDFDAIADWLSKAIGQHDPAILSMLRLWYRRDLRSTPCWETVMRKLNLPEA